MMKDTWLERAVTLSEWKYRHELLDWCLKWTKGEPERAIAWFYLGKAYGYLNDLNNEKDAFRQAVRIDPENFEAWQNIGMASLVLEHYDEAIEAYQQVVHVDPKQHKYFGTWYSLGDAYRHIKRYNDAIEAYRQELLNHPERPDAWYNLGIVYFQSGNKTAARGAAKELLRIDPALADKLFKKIKKEEDTMLEGDDYQLKSTHEPDEP
jgi:tetratricopeptide (TPR) repeat protein